MSRAREPELAEATKKQSKKRGLRVRRRAGRDEVDDPTHDLDGVAATAEEDDAPEAEVLDADEPEAEALEAEAPEAKVPEAKVVDVEAPAGPPFVFTAQDDDTVVIPVVKADTTEAEAEAPVEAEVEESHPAPPGAFALQRRKAVILVVVGAVIVAFLGWLVGRQIESPADVAARSAAPAASPILASVEEKKLSTTVIARGTAGFGSPRPVTLAPSGFKDVGVVTSLPKLSESIPEGGVLLTVSGRPVFAIAGDTPMYRDLGPGIVGQDVLQLEAALARLGLNPGAVDGTYDAATEGAVRAMYNAAGFQPIVANLAQLDAIRPTQAQFDPGSRAGPGVQVPADEVFFVPGTPVRITELPVAVGQELISPLMTVSDSSVKIAGSLRVEEAKLVKPGMKVDIDEPDLGIEARGEVVSVADAPGTLGEDQFHVHFEVAVDKPPDGLNGVSVRLTVPIKSTKGKALTVPVSALSLAADGSSRVEVLRNDAFEEVVVKPGLSAGGLVEVKPAEKGQLEVGDKVVVGVNS